MSDERFVPDGTRGTVSPPHWSEGKGWHRDLYVTADGKHIKMPSEFFPVVPEPLGDLARGLEFTQNLPSDPPGTFYRQTHGGPVERVLPY